MRNTRTVIVVAANGLKRYELRDGMVYYSDILTRKVGSKKFDSRHDAMTFIRQNVEKDNIHLH